MVDLNSALESGNLSVLLGTAAALGFLHTILGPDHYVPFVMMAKAQKWSRRKATIITFLCAVGHVASSVAIGAGLAAAGMAVTRWEGSGWASWHESRGGVAAWLLMGVGAAFLVWGLVRALRGRTHTHVHVHEDGEDHLHEHDHRGDHLHAHESKVKRLTPWILFTLFVFGPCESLIPLMLAAWASAGWGGAALTAGVFSATTILTVMGSVGVLLFGISLVPLRGLERWSTAAAGLSLVLCGAAIHWLGL
ncbi:MAG: sulfite exporter TauE/SafE family protein [Planctomycetota bacterium]|jgi:ABC-type nickel/cobalt efflux system permease component RcnA